MNKRVVIILACFVLALSLILAANNTSTGTITVNTDNTNVDQITKAYSCLDNKIDDLGCSKFSLEEKTFTAIATGDCVSELVAESKNDKECWPKDNCKIKSTAQALLAMYRVGGDTEKAEAWLLSQNASANDLIWYLQVDSNEKANCKVSYNGQTYSFIVQDDKKLSSNAGICLTKSEGDYWFRVSPECYSKEFEVTCDKGFLTSLLFKKKTSSTIHVPQSSHSGSAESKTIEKITSLCFAQAGVCNYEGSLWATMILKYLGNDVSSYLPYLVTFADENREFLPESFLFYLTGSQDYRSDLLKKQKYNQYWLEASDKFYDTAVALLPFDNENPLEKSNSLSWLLEKGVQDDAGCWKDNIRNTAFLLYSAWPRQILVSEPDLNCEAESYYCMSSIQCTGVILEGYACAGLSKCCDAPREVSTCTENSGALCSSTQNCDGNIVDSSDDGLDKTCCVGSCVNPPVETECEQNSGACRSFCGDTEKAITYGCTSSSERCCVTDTKKESKSYWWLWLLIILIVLLVLGIVFREKLYPFWLRISSKFYRPSNQGSVSQRAPTNPLLQRLVPRRILSPQNNAPSGPQPQKKVSPELDDVLKKLRDMGSR